MNLKKIRKKRGLTLDELGKLYGCSRQAMWKFENSKKLPSKKVLRKLADVLCIPVSVLIDEDNEDF